MDAALDPFAFEPVVVESVVVDGELELNPAAEGPTPPAAPGRMMIKTMTAMTTMIPKRTISRRRQYTELA